jgi:hypothetical protein
MTTPWRGGGNLEFHSRVLLQIVGHITTSHSNHRGVTLEEGSDEKMHSGLDLESITYLIYSDCLHYGTV